LSLCLLAGPCLFFLSFPRPPPPPPFPYPTLFRSRWSTAERLCGTRARRCPSFMGCASKTASFCSPPCYRRSPICASRAPSRAPRSEEHTSELQSRFDLVCRLLLEKKKDTQVMYGV